MTEEISISGNSRLAAAQRAKNDEFYTQYSDIEEELNGYVSFNKDVFREKTVLLPCDDPEWSNFTRYFAANFEWLGLKKLISTSYAKEDDGRGKLFILDEDINNSGRIDIDDLKWEYLEGNGDFQSDEVTQLRNEADIIVTNPPFSLFRKFLEWIIDGKKQFIIMGNKNAITYKEVFPLLKENLMWVGYTSLSGGRWMQLPDGENVKRQDLLRYNREGRPIMNVPGVCWFSNVEHGKRHELMQLDTMAHLLKYNKQLRKNLEESYGKIEYPHYDNYDAIEVPFTNCIPSDYDGVMGVPITFLDKFNPEQFEILGADGFDEYTPPTKTYKAKQKVVNGVHQKSLTGKLGCTIRCDTFGKGTFFDVGYPVSNCYKRIFIRHKMGGAASSRAEVK